MKQIKDLSNAEERLEELEFVRKFDNDHQSITAAVVKQEYTNVLKYYKSLLIDEVLVSLIFTTVNLVFVRRRNFF